MNQLRDLNKSLRDLGHAAQEWQKDVEQSQNFIQQNFSLKLRSDLEGFDNFM